MIKIDEAICKACGLCGRVCPRYVIETKKVDGGKRTKVSPEREAICVHCGQCMAICPNGAVQVDGFTAEDFRPLGPLTCSEEQFISLLTHRRSVRRYKDKPVSRHVLDRIVDVACWAPTLSGQDTIGVIIIDQAEVLRKFSEKLYAFYDYVEKKLQNPIARLFMTRAAGKRRIESLKNFAMPGVRWYTRWYREGRSNEIIRDCPALILFHAPIFEPEGDVCCIIAGWQVVLMAEALGLGTCFNGLLPPACNRSPELREFIGLPEDREVYAGLTLGYPKYKYKSTIRRRLFEARYLGEGVAS